VTELGVVVQSYLAVESQNLSIFCFNQRVNLNQGCVFLNEHFVKFHKNRGNLGCGCLVEATGLGNSQRLIQIDTGHRVNRNLG
jgi:hypothetical protein